MIVTLITTLTLLALAIALVRHVLLLGRTVGRFQAEVQPVVDEIARQGARAADRAGTMSDRAPRRS